MLTYQETALKYKVDISLLYRRAHLLKIEGKRDGKQIRLSREQIKEILNYSPPSRSKEFDKRKLAIVEFYQKWGTGNKVARFLNLHRNVVNAAIKEYKQDGTVTVESKMNR